MSRDANARRVDAEQGSCRGDGEVRCLACGTELIPDEADEMREGLCEEHMGFAR